MNVGDGKIAGYLFHVTGHVTGNISLVSRDIFVKYQFLVGWGERGDLSTRVI